MNKHIGVYPGIVVDNKDAQKMGRVHVIIPALSESESAYCARVSVPVAGNGGGMFFLPDNDDEVLVYLGEGEQDAYILGALWNGKDKAPGSNEDDKNSLKIIKTRSGHTIKLDDTEGKENIQITDKSEKNSIVIDTQKNSITIKTAGDFIVEAPQGNIKLSARNVEISSSGSTKMKAGGGMNLDGSPGTVVIKGTTVNIN